MTDTPQTYRPDPESPRWIVTANDRFVCKAADVETAARIVQALNLFQYIQDHEASDGVIAKRLLWAVEAEKVLRMMWDQWSGHSQIDDPDWDGYPVMSAVHGLLTDTHSATPPRAVEEGE